jgi:hypothetical protein
MPIETTISAKEFIRYLEERLHIHDLRPPLIPWPEAIGYFGREDIIVSSSDVGDATLSTKRPPAPTQARPSRS